MLGVQCAHVLGNSPGQGSSEHFSIWTASPSHSAPPFFGAGLLHSLSLVISPSPQSTEQSDQSPKSLHPPLTEFKKSLRYCGRNTGTWICKFTKSVAENLS